VRTIPDLLLRRKGGRNQRKKINKWIGKKERNLEKRKQSEE
jgi:hypothetical protein